MNRFIHILVLICAVSCIKRDGSGALESFALQDKPIKDTAISSSRNQIVEVINIEFDTLIFPRNDQTYSCKILTTGQFHSDEVWNDVDKETWLGLFKASNGFYIRKTIITTARINDPILDDEDQKTGWEIKTDDINPSLILISNVDYISERNIEGASSVKTHVYPGDTIKLNYLGIDYIIHASGGKRKVQSEPEWYEVWNYKLYLTALKDDKVITQLLVAQPNFDDQMIRIIFAGDIDGDNFIDMIIDTSRHYNATSPTLYLSRPASDGQILKVVGIHTAVGC